MRTYVKLSETRSGFSRRGAEKHGARERGDRIGSTPPTRTCSESALESGRRSSEPLDELSTEHASDLFAFFLLY
jgi:hypothetical protein